MKTQLRNLIMEQLQRCAHTEIAVETTFELFLRKRKNFIQAVETACKRLDNRRKHFILARDSHGTSFIVNCKNQRYFIAINSETYNVEVERA